MKDNRLTFSVKVDEAALKRFQFYSVYHNVQGISAIIISALCIVYLIVGWGRLSPGMKMLLVFLGVLYIAIRPVQIILKTKLTSRQEAFQKPLNFVFEDEKITVSQGEESVEFTWLQIMKIVTRKKDVYIYTGKLYAYMIPKEQTGDAWKKLISMAEGKGCRIVV